MLSIHRDSSRTSKNGEKQQTKLRRQIGRKADIDQAALQPRDMTRTFQVERQQLRKLRNTKIRGLSIIATPSTQRYIFQDLSQIEWVHAPHTRHTQAHRQGGNKGQKAAEHSEACNE